MVTFPAEKISAYDRPLAAAATLLYNHGIAATGIGAIVKRAGVARKSLYNNFDSKAEVVAACLRIRHADWLALYAARLQQAQGPTARVPSIFDAYADHAEHAYERGFRGRGLLNAAAELQAGDDGRNAVRSHKEEVETLLRTHLGELLPAAPERAGLEDRSDCVQQAGAIAASMLEAK